MAEAIVGNHISVSYKEENIYMFKFTELTEGAVVASGSKFVFKELLLTVAETELVPTEGLAYTLSNDGTYYICSGIGTATETDIVIASEIDGIPVEGILNFAFFSCSSLTSITIPDGVTRIGNYAFENCSKLTTVYYMGTEEQWNSINIEFGDFPLNVTIIYNYNPTQRN